MNEAGMRIAWEPESLEYALEALFWRKEPACSHVSVLGTSVLLSVSESKEDGVTDDSLVGLGPRSRRSCPDCRRHLERP